MQPAGNSAQALQNLQAFQGQIKAPQDILKDQQTQLGVPQQQQQVSGLRQAITNTTNLLNQVAPSVYGRTQNSLVTSAQAGRQIQNEQAPIATNLNKQETDYTGANSDLDRALQQAAQASSLQVTGQQQQLDNLKSIYGAYYQQEQDAAARELENQKLALAKSQAASSANNGLSLGGLGAAASLTPKAPSIQDQAYLSVQNFLKQGNTAATSDYAATKASADRGNALDKLKIQLYNQAGINPVAYPGIAGLTFGNGVPGLTIGKAGGLTY